MKRWLPILAIASATILVFGITLSFEFLNWDDDNLIIANPYVNPPSPAAACAAWAHVHQHLYIPLTYNLWALLAYAGQGRVPDEMGNTLNPYVFHLANVALHLCAALLVYGIARLLLKRQWIAVAAAVFWAIHPLQVEPVAWATGMKDVLSGALALLSIYLYLRAATGASSCWNYIASAGCLLVASFAKPGIVSVPMMVTAIDLLWLRRPWRLVLGDVLPMVVAVVPALAITSLIAQPAGDMGLCAAWQRPFVAGHALVVYMEKVFWPAQLTVDYGMSPANVLKAPWVYAACIVPIIVSLVLLAWRAGRRELAAAWLVFVAGLASVLGLLPFVFQYYSTVADRYAYLAMLGAALAFGWFLTRIPPRFVALAAFAILIALAGRSLIQVQTWSDSQSVFEHTIAVNPRSFLGHGQLGSILIFKGDMVARQGDAGAGEQLEKEGEQHLRQSLQVWPDYPGALMSLSIYYLQSGRIDEGLEMRQRAVEAIDKLPPALTQGSRLRFAFAQTLLRYGHRQQAIDNLELFLRRNPGDPEAAKLLNDVRSAQ